MSWNEAEAGITLILGAFSIFFTICIILTSIFLPQCRTQARLLVLYLSLTNLGQGLFFVLPNASHYSNTFCIALSIYSVFVDTASYLFTVCISYYVYKAIKEP